jgi:hypothetical protein
MVTDLEGDLYLTADFSTFSYGSMNLTASGGKDILLLKIGQNGLLKWHKQYGSSADETTGELCRKGGSILMGANAGSAMNVEGITVSGGSFFIAEFLPGGSLADLTQYQGGSIWEIETDAAGNLYLLGNITEADTLDLGGSFQLPGTCNDCMGSHFLAKQDTQGNTLWAQDMGSNYYTPHRTLGIDEDQNIYLNKWGRYSGFTIKKFDPSGAPGWYYNISGTYGDCNSICVVSGHSIWVTGYIWNGPDGSNPFLWEFDNSGTPAFDVPSNSEDVSGFSVCHHNGSIYVSGVFKDQISFGAHDLSAAGTGFFISKLNTNSVPTAIAGIQTDAHLLNIYPNPGTGVFQLELDNERTESQRQIRISDISGRTVYESRLKGPENTVAIDLEGISPGVYSVEVLTGNLRRVKRIVIN